MGVTYDTGALIAADRGERRMGARHRALLARPSGSDGSGAGRGPVLAWIGPAGPACLSAGRCDVEALDDGQARAVGALAARAATTEFVDACVVEGAVRRRDLVVSSDPGDLRMIAAGVDERLEIDQPGSAAAPIWGTAVAVRRQQAGVGRSVDGDLVRACCGWCCSTRSNGPAGLHRCGLRRRTACTQSACPIQATPDRGQLPGQARPGRWLLTARSIRNPSPGVLGARADGIA